jgi:adenylate cyclase
MIDGRAPYRHDADIQMQPSSIDVIASALEPVTLDLGRASSPDGAVTLMFSDIADASIVAEELGPERWGQLLGDHQLLVGQLIAHHDGAVVRLERDGFFATFGSAHAGLGAAIELQQTFASPASNGQPSVALRIGLHSGFVIAADSAQPLGRNVVLASRIAAAAKGGEILVSSALKEYTERDPSLSFELRGEHHFNGVVGEHTVYRVRSI